MSHLIKSPAVICPRCEQPLRRVQTNAGERLDCARCEGRAVSRSAVLAQLSEEDAVTFERKARSRAVCAGRTRCPQCLVRTNRIQLGDNEDGLQVDACANCALVWLDRGEWAQLSRYDRRSLTKEESQRTEARGILELSRARDELNQETRAPEPAAAYVAGLLGFPVEHRAPQRSAGFVTWAMLAGMVHFTVWHAFEPHLDDILGFKPAEPFRLGGLTLFTSMFLHGGLLHLLGNAYFLWVFGKAVEHSLGSTPFMLLFVAGGLLGSGASWIAHSASNLTLIGASSGISATIVYYALALQGARVKLHLGRAGGWVTVSARAAVVMWLALQIVGAAKELAGFGRVAYTAHLGGAVAGVLAWLWRYRVRSP